MTTTLVKNPLTGTFEADSGNPSGTGRSLMDLMGPGGMTPPSAGGSPYNVFNKNLATILSQMQMQSMQGANQLGTAKDTLATGLINSAPAYDPRFNPQSNLVGQENALEEGTSGPGVTSVNTQLQNANAGVERLGTVIGGLETAYQPNYQPVINPATGMMDGFDTRTGTWSSGDQGGGGADGNSTTHPSEMGGPGVIGGINLGSTPGGLGAYATDTKYFDEIRALYDPIATSGVTANAQTLSDYIKGHHNSSPITGQLILNAANLYKVDPALLTAMMAHESDFGTAGQAPKNNNPGGILYVGQAGASQGTLRPASEGGHYAAYNSWQQGINAMAANLAQRKVVAGTSSTPGQSGTSNVGGTFAPEGQTKVSQLPPYMQVYAQAGPAGVAYIDDEKVPENVKQSVQALSARVGIPYVRAQDTVALKSMQTVLSNLETMETLADKNLVSGPLGHLYGQTIGALQENRQTPHGVQLGLFDNYRDTAIKAVQSLAGGAGSGLRINGAEIQANTQNLPTSNDSKENAIAKIKQLRQLIYTQLAASFPYAPVPVVNTSGQKGNIPASNLAAAVAAGYTVQ